jgi:protein-S-isoprenylcysteine O-methyltransferase Ste14
MIALTLGTAVGLAASQATAPQFAGAYRAVGLGLAIRVTAIAASAARFALLSRSTPGKPSSPPARTGGCVTLPTALLWRIHVEEAELTAVLGDPYRAYQAHTKRLIPGLW